MTERGFFSSDRRDDSSPLFPEVLTLTLAVRQNAAVSVGAMLTHTLSER